MHQTAIQATHRRRPRAVSFVASLVFVEAVFVVVIGLLMASSQVATTPVFTLSP